MTLNTILTIAAVVVVFIILFKVFKWVLRLLVVVVFLLIAFVTNPTPEQHQEALARKADQNNVDIRGKKIVVDDYYVFSLTHVLENDEDKVIGAGAFTQVVIFRNP